MSDNLGKVSKYRATPSEGSRIDLDEARRDADSSVHMLGYALLVITLVLAVVILWPWLSERFA